MAKVSSREYREFTALVRGQLHQEGDIRPIVLELILEVTRLREALDDIAMGASRRVAFDALKGGFDAVGTLPWLRTFEGHQGAGDIKEKAEV